MLTGPSPSPIVAPTAPDRASPEPFYRLARVPLADLPAEGDVFGRIFRRELNGVVISGVLTEARAASLVARLEAGAVTVPRRRFAREFEAYSIGPCLDQAEHGVDAYFDAVPTFAREARTLFADDAAHHDERAQRGDVRKAALAVPEIESVLAAIAGGREVVLPCDPAGRPYGRTTLRCLPPGGLIPPHCENEQLLRSPYDHLRTRIDPAALISFYLTLAPAEEGGELSIHALGFHELDRSRMRAGHSDMTADLAARDALTVKPLAGEMIVFDGGRYFHQVLPVRGTKNRWTMGGFMAMSPDGRAALAWA